MEQSFYPPRGAACKGLQGACLTLSCSPEASAQAVQKLRTLLLNLLLPLAGDGEKDEATYTDPEHLQGMPQLCERRPKARWLAVSCSLSNVRHWPGAQHPIWIEYRARGSCHLRSMPITGQFSLH